MKSRRLPRIPLREANNTSLEERPRRQGAAGTSGRGDQQLVGKLCTLSQRQRQAGEKHNGLVWSAGLLLLLPRDAATRRAGTARGTAFAPASAKHQVVNRYATGVGSQLGWDCLEKRRHGVTLLRSAPYPTGTLFLRAEGDSPVRDRNSHANRGARSLTP